MSWQLRLLNPYLRLTEKAHLRRAKGAQALRRSFEIKARLFFHGPWSVTSNPRVIAGRDAIEVSPKAAADGVVILCFHGGGYVFGSPKTHRAMLGKLAALSGVRAVLPKFRLAPEHPHPAAIEDALEVYQALAQEGTQVILGGDSAGGGLALAVLAQAIALGLPKPRATFAFSPLTDMTYSAPSVRENAAKDVILPSERVHDMTEAFIGDGDRKDPRASPLYADFKGAGPVWFTVGDTEILRDDTLRLAAKMQDQRVDVSLAVKPDHPHVWPLFHTFLPEARRSLRDVAIWITALSTTLSDS